MQTLQYLPCTIMYRPLPTRQGPTQAVGQLQTAVCWPTACIAWCKDAARAPSCATAKLLDCCLQLLSMGMEHVACKPCRAHAGRASALQAPSIHRNRAVFIASLWRALNSHWLQTLAHGMPYSLRLRYIACAKWCTLCYAPGPADHCSETSMTEWRTCDLSSQNSASFPGMPVNSLGMLQPREHISMLRVESTQLGCP